MVSLSGRLGTAATLHRKRETLVRASLTITVDGPKEIWAFAILPSGRKLRPLSLSSRACSRKAIYASAPSTQMYGVTIEKPGAHA